MIDKAHGLGVAHRVFLVQQTVVGGLHVLSGQFFAAVELDALAQVEGPGQLVFGDFPALGNVAHDTQLIHQGVESRVCLFKGENHELSRSGKPWNRVKRLDGIDAWMDAHLKA